MSKNTKKFSPERIEMILLSREYDKFYDNFHANIGTGYTKTALAGFIKFKYNFTAILIADMIDVEDRAISELLKGFSTNTKLTQKTVIKLNELLDNDEHREITQKLQTKIEQIKTMYIEPKINIYIRTDKKHGKRCK
ncbi:MAG: hypothetical protein ABFC34_13830 [Methanobacterium sp.]